MKMKPIKAWAVFTKNKISCVHHTERAAKLCALSYQRVVRVEIREVKK